MIQNKTHMQKFQVLFSLNRYIKKTRYNKLPCPENVDKRLNNCFTLLRKWSSLLNDVNNYCHEAIHTLNPPEPLPPSVSKINLAHHDAFEKSIPESILQVQPYTAHSKPSIPNITWLEIHNLLLHTEETVGGKCTVNFDSNNMIFYVK